MSELPEGDDGPREAKGDLGQSVPSDDEDDYEGYFLEPVASSVDIAEKIAEANRKLLEDVGEDDREAESRPRKVQFSEELVNFEPNDYSDDDCTQSAQNSIISEEDLEVKPPQDDRKNENPEISEREEQETTRDDDIPEEIREETDATTLQDTTDEPPERNSKLILVLLPKEQNSSCESIIGEEIQEEVKNGVENTRVELEKPIKTKIARPKSAKKSCDMSKISPSLSCSSGLERKSWQTSPNPLLKSKSKREEGREKKNVFIGEIKVQIKGRFLKKINIDDLNLDGAPAGENLKRCSNRPRSCRTGRNSTGGENRPRTAPMQRTCCVIKTELPQYNGLRSEYGLSAEQLQERKQKSLENRLKKKQEQIKKHQEQVQRRNENEETFQKWLFNKTKKSFRKKSLKLRDTLSRSDVYIQSHASYAANRSVPYCLDYSLTKKMNNRKRDPHGKKSKTIVVEKLLDNMTPHFKRSFNIYLGVKS